MGSPEVLFALKNSRFGRLSYDREGRISPALAISPKSQIIPSPSPSANRKIQRITASPVSAERVLFSPSDPNRPKELQSVETRLRSPKDYELPSSPIDGDPAVCAKETSSPGVGAEVLHESIPDEEEVLREGFDVVLRIEDALDDVSRELMLYEERTEIALRKSIKARVKMVRSAYLKFLADSRDKYRLAVEQAEEERRLRNLEAEKTERLWRMEMQRHYEKMKSSMDSKAQELKSKTENFEEELNKERNLLRARFDQLIKLEKSTSDKIVEAIRISSELAKAVPKQSVDAVLKKVDAQIASAKRCLDLVAAGKAKTAASSAPIAEVDADINRLQIEDAAMQQCLNMLQEANERVVKEVEQAQKAREQAELAEQQEAARNQQISAEIPRREDKLRISSSGLALYARLIDKVEQYEAAAKAVSEDPAMKSFRFQLMKAVTIPINAISNDVSSNFREMSQRLVRLLVGESVEAGSESKKQGEDQVASKSESAFPLAAAVVILWMRCPEFGDVFLGKLFHSCPYLVPFYPTLPSDIVAKDQAHRDDLTRATEGRKKEKDDTWEDDGQFYRRMGGLARLYGAVVQTIVAPGKSHPCGPEKGWQMIADILRLEPKEGVTATVLADFLLTAGHRLGAVYGKQFFKMLLCLQGPFRRKLSAGSPVVRLEEIVNSGLKDGGRIPAPKGVLAIPI